LVEQDVYTVKVGSSSLSSPTIYFSYCYLLREFGLRCLMDLETALKALRAQDYFVWDDFLSPQEVLSAIRDSENIYEAGSFKRSGIGNRGSERQLDSFVRSDEVYWLDPLSLTPVQRCFWDRLESLKASINQNLFLGLWELEGHYSRYPVDGFYTRHLDSFRDQNQRVISMVLYFNSEWASSAGGELRIHLPLATPPQADYSPLGGRLICFLSSTISHEVLPAKAVRYSFAGWWKRFPGPLPG
jgi:SM-20-related protein